MAGSRSSWYMAFGVSISAIATFLEKMQRENVKAVNNKSLIGTAKYSCNVGY
jgi:hypothetical protein